MVLTRHAVLIREDGDFPAAPVSAMPDFGRAFLCRQIVCSCHAYHLVGREHGAYAINKADRKSPHNRQFSKESTYGFALITATLEIRFTASNVLSPTETASEILSDRFR